MPASLTTRRYSNFAFDVRREQAMRHADQQGQPLATPEEIELVVVAFTDVQNMDGPQRYEYAFLPEFFEVFRNQVLGGVVVAQPGVLRDLGSNGRAS